MTDTVMGGNSQARLRGFVDRIENVNKKIDDLRDDRRVIVAELKADGFEPKYVGRIIRKRRMKPHDRQEEEALEATYMHAAGLDQEPPLFRSIGAIAKDATSRDKVIDAFKLMCPPKGEIVVKIGGQPVRIFRDKDGVAQVEDWVDPGSAPSPRSSGASIPPRPKVEVPDVDEEGAKALGKAYAKDNKPVTDNPFPFGDKRRSFFDEGWRDGTGNDGMGG